MARSNLFRKRPPVPGIGYLRHSVDLERLLMVGRWIVVEEIFDEQEQPSGILVVGQGTPHTVRGRVLKAGPEAALDGLKVGEEVIYDEWQGGRHDLGGRRTLIMACDSVLCRVETG